ncbi:MAG: 16S rRNA (guanine(527)-N(7))-methyltransferase RsmG [Clostridia bacterium]|nr:16S rRNA (guanine(527)-N(7))-methyltransferase RsmG [Clostridia bacterium]
MFSDFYEIYLTSTAGLPDPFRTEKIARKLYRHLEELSEKGRLFNLTAIDDERDAVNKHTVDSLYAAEVVAELSKGESASLIDVGSGAGFPALPIATACGNIAVTALDSTAKKCEFISSAANVCGVSVSVLSERAEEAAKDLRETFDFATARAVARLNILAELCAPFVKVGGYFVAMKGSAAKEEANEAERAVKTLGLEFESAKNYAIKNGGERSIIIYKKIAPTPCGYPRRYALIKKKPL